MQDDFKVLVERSDRAANVEEKEVIIFIGETDSIGAKVHFSRWLDDYQGWEKESAISETRLQKQIYQLCLEGEQRKNDEKLIDKTQENNQKEREVNLPLEEERRKSSKHLLLLQEDKVPKPEVDLKVSKERPLPVIFLDIKEVNYFNFGNNKQNLLCNS